MSEAKDSKQPTPRFFEGLESDYANNVAFESTVWDLKLIFGEYWDNDKSVQWHTSMTIPWAQAKLLSHYLRVNVEGYEAENGPIRVPSKMIPQEPPPPASNAAELDKKIYEIFKRRHREFVESLP